jgi:hypothetical protein
MKKSISSTLLMAFLFLYSCKKEEPATIPVLSTAPATNITTATATSGGTIANDGGASITANGVCWGATDNPTINDSKTNDNVHTGQFVSNIIGLTGGTTYHVRAYATNSVGTAYGSNVSFLTLGQAPSSVTLAATNISTTGATLNGTVNPNYLSTTVSFEYGTTTSYGQTVTATQSPVTGNNTTNVIADISGLTAGTTYYFRLKTVNSLGTTYSEDKTFTTLGQPPLATTLAATNIVPAGATLNGSVNANNLSTTVTFEYGTTTSYGSTAIATQSPIVGNTLTNVSASIAGLTAGTTYHFRVKAVNSVGITYGNDMTFLSLNNPPVLPPAESMIIDFSNFYAENASGTQINKWKLVSQATEIWRAIITTTLKIPIASYQAAFNSNPIYIGNNIWEREYDVSIEGLIYKARLTSQIREADYKWQMYITKEGDGAFAEFLWLEGTSNLDGTSGQWIFDESPQNQVPVFQIDWSVTGDKIGMIKYTYTKTGSTFKDSYIEYGLTSNTLNAYYTIHYYNTSFQQFYDMNVEWNTVLHNGRVKCMMYFGTYDWYCWDNNYLNVTCP